MEQVKSKTDKGQEEAPDQAAGKENGGDSEGLWARVPYPPGQWGVGWEGLQQAGEEGRESRLEGDRP